MAPRTTGPRPRYGKIRTNPTTGRDWRVTLYYGSAPRVAYIDPDTQRYTTRRVRRGDDPDSLFEQVERYLDQRVVVAGALQQPNIRALGARYLAWLEQKQREQSYITKQRGILDKWVYPIIGDVAVANWSPEDSIKVRAAAVREVGPHRLADIGLALSGLRRTAYRRTGGRAWLSRDNDPLEDVSFTARSQVHGEHPRYVPPSLRPSRAQVDAVIAAARRRDTERGTRLGLMYTIAGYFGLRLGEQLALRSIDVDLRRRVLHVNGSQTQPRDSQGRTVPPYRKCVKTGDVRTVPYWASLDDDLRRACAAALHLPSGATTDTVADAIEAERARRQATADAGTARTYNGRPARFWWEVVTDRDRECWLFTPPRQCTPWKREGFNDEWHRVREIAAQAAAASTPQGTRAAAWPTSIPYLNMRHHAATYLHQTFNDWAVVARYLGNSVRICISTYARPGDDADERAHEIFADC